MSKIKKNIVAVLFSVIYFTLFSFGLAKADGIFIPFEREDLYEPHQTALIVFENSNEELYLNVGHQGDASKFVWIVPTPSLLKVTEAPATLFVELHEITKPNVKYDSTYKGNWGSTDIFNDAEKVVVHSKERILMIFDDPIVKKADIYDGYRTLTELVRYVAAEKQVHFMPDWWAVFETNYEGAPDFWGRDVESVLENIELWKADYAIIYQDSGSELEGKWEEAGFQVLNKFSWTDYDTDMQGVRPYYGATPDWWLLKK